jgi:hypothetical protein
MLGLNGGLMGVLKVPTTGTATGLWDQNEQSVAKRAGIWPSVVGVDPDFASVSLLLHMDGSNGSTTFTDSSSNALTITPNGGVQISTAQSKFGGTSALLDNDSKFLGIPSGSLFQFPGDFTVECFVYPTAFSQLLSAIEIGEYTDGVLIRAWSSTTGTVFVNNTSLGSASDFISVNTWHHLALTRQGTSVKYFINGTERLTATVSGTVNSTAAASRIGKINVANNQGMRGYVDEVRVTKGVARYTANFTPPTAPFPNSQ